MYCDYHEENVTLNDCASCSRNSCPNHPRNEEKAEARKAAIERLQSSEIAKQIKDRFVGLLGCSQEDVDRMTCDLFSSAFGIAQSEARTVIQEEAKIRAIEHVKSKAAEEINKVFDVALSEQILVFDGSKEVVTTTIQKIISERLSAFISTKGQYGRKGNVEKTIERAIEKSLESRVEEALRELTNEAIDRFNKEAMKKMMSGMAKAIQGDKRLLSMLTE
jgi:hypothetical protein